MDALTRSGTDDGTTQDTQSLIEDLLGLGDMRVWSVIITVFGDSIQPRGGTVAATTLARLLTGLGIRPAALRVALHRLVRDGWILRRQEGRNSFYRLSATGLARFEPATRRIYAAAPAGDGAWRLLCTATEAAEPGAPFVALRPGLFIGPVPASGAGGDAGRANADSLVLNADVLAVPGWVKTALAPSPLPEEFVQLEGVLERMAAALSEAGPPDGLDATVLRTLLVHRWRRLLLRHADLPLRFFPDGWRGEACRALFLDLHARLSIQAGDWLDREVAPAR